MKKLIVLTVFSVIGVFSCKNRPEPEISEEKMFNQELYNELEAMYEFDQYTSGMPQGEFEGDWEGWFAYRDSTTKVMKKRLDEIFTTHGYPGYDLVGEEGSSNFWNMVQHCDFDPSFQLKVQEAMKMEVDENNASSMDLAFLIDRVNLNLGKKQLYGTQVNYDMERGLVYSKPVDDSLNINTRRKEMGLEPIEKYLNELSKMHYELNKSHYLKLGIMEPKLYDEK